ncbi:hypothetical protein [Clostridium butanoliproducens]|uniref:hypothetical protein n=1 Tax=Clostridium butanoliproducens TaxID=2991837 RepID=UPI0024BAF254|nr:hypothetical protein [Clostridium butanoliproducens]
MKYIGPFLRINILDNENIKSQLFYLSKESIAHIVLSSNCGIISPNDHLRNKILPTNDNSINHGNSPLLSLYKKADGRLINENDKLKWNNKKFKREINIASNAYMTLGLLELADYYSNFIDIDDDKYSLKTYYLDLAKEQLEFYALNCRNNEGVFVDKVDTSEPLLGQYNLHDKENKFKFSNQALLMTAYYKCSTYDKISENNQFKNFALDILNMFEQFKEEIYNVSHDELVKICFAFNIFYKYSKLDNALVLLLDFSELMMENFKHIPISALKENLATTCLLYINCMILYKTTGIRKFKDESEKAYSLLENLYQNDNGIFIKDFQEKENKFASDEIILYLCAMMLHYDIEKEENEDPDNSIIYNIYKNQVIGSGLILSWPEAPTLDDVERYKNFSSKAEDLLQDEFFRMSSMSTPENSELAPIFAKYVTYSNKKQTFKPSKPSFDAYRNMFIFYVILFLKTL